MLKSLKAQILLVSILLVILLLTQVFLSRKDHSTFVNSLDLTQAAVVKVSLVRELERDVIDLQRNVLIYKESASESAISRFNRLMKQNQLNLQKLEKLTEQDSQSGVYLDYISRMRSHLKEYDENFANVIIGRTKRQYIRTIGVLTELGALFDDIKISKMPPQQHHLQMVKYHLARAQNFLLQYLSSPEQELVKSFNKQLADAKEVVNSNITGEETKTIMLHKLDDINQDFQQLSKITRGYLFLVNVVMAGSANEFLFLARELNRLVTDNLTGTNINVKQSMEATNLQSDIFSTFGIILAITLALFLVYRIMVPIKNITEIFQKLTKGEDIQDVLDTDRKDEIGYLAKAASVFHEKNKQTTVLLQQSQTLNAKQEALNQQLLLSNRQAEQATESKSMFLANMSHEIRTPMNGIIGLVDIVLGTKLTDSQREKLDKVAYSGKILLNLINDILDFSKIEAGHLDIEKINFSMNSILNNTLANITTRAKEKNLNVLFYVNPSLPAQLIGDPLRITQVLLNLCSNAVKFTLNGMIKINIDFVKSEQNNQISLIMEVIDTGIGMSKEQTNKVFNSFTQADGSTSRNFGGTGLGLSIVKQLVNLMGGSIHVDSETGKGSNFTVKLDLEVERNSTPILKEKAISSGKFYYFSEGRKGLLADSYIEKVMVNYHHLPISQLPSVINEIKSNDAIAIDVNSLPSFKSIHKLVEQVKNKTNQLGFVTNTQPSNLTSQLTNLWPAECLSHPFEPQEAADFLSKLFGEATSTHSTKQSAENIDRENCSYLGHVLLVEDNHINQAVAGEMLKILGITFDIAEDGLQAVTKVNNSPFYDLILMDIQMPVMDGYKATQEIRSSGHNELTICGLSANAMQEDFDRAIDAGMNDYLTKPIKQKALEGLISKYLPKS